MQAQSTGASPFTQLKPHTPTIASGHQPCDLDGVLVGGPRGSLPQRPIGEPPPRPAQGPRHLAVEGRQVTGRPIRSLSVAEGVAGGKPPPGRGASRVRTETTPAAASSGGLRRTAASAGRDRSSARVVAAAARNPAMPCRILSHVVSCWRTRARRAAATNAEAAPACTGRTR